MSYKTFILYCDSPAGLIWKDSSGALVHLPYILSFTFLRKGGENVSSATISCPYPFYLGQPWLRGMKKNPSARDIYVQGLPKSICHPLIMDYVLVEYGIPWFSDLRPRNESVTSLGSIIHSIFSWILSIKCASPATELDWFVSQTCPGTALVICHSELSIVIELGAITFS